MARETLPEWAKVGARFVTSDRWGSGMEVYTITRTTDTSAWARASSGGSETRFVYGYAARTGDDLAALKVYGADRWSNTYGYSVDSAGGKSMLATAREHHRRRRIRQSFDKLYKDWQRRDAVVLVGQLQEWLDLNPAEEVDDGTRQEV